MYNLIVSGDSEAFQGKFHSVDISRVLEYTGDDVKDRFSKLDENALHELIQYPCLFVYENHCGGPPKFGWLRSLKRRSNAMHMECEYVDFAPGITEREFDSIQSRLDIYGWEMSRTHWAVKDVDLQEEFQEIGISLPFLNGKTTPTINPDFHVFDVAFSFPGEARERVEGVIEHLGRKLSTNQIFYDNFYKAFLARPNLDTYLSDIYRNRSKLIVAFLSSDYEKKSWPNLEFRTVREIIFNQEHDKVMYIRLDDTPINGVLKTDGYIDARNHTNQEIAHFIFQRVTAQKQ